MVRHALVAGLSVICAKSLRAEDSRTGEWIAPEVAEFGEWSVACDNVKECTAVSISREFVRRIESSEHGDYGMPKLWVKRRAGPNAKAKVFVDTRTFGETSESRSLTLHVYYECDGDCIGRAYRLDLVEPGRYELAQDQVASFFAESVKSDRAATRLADGAMHGLISTSGLIAAMRYIDEAQGRRDTVTAIYAKGQLPARAVPEERRRPVVKVVGGFDEPVTEGYDISAIEAKQAEHCGLPAPTGVSAATLRIRLKNGQNLWSVACKSTLDAKYRLWLVETKANDFGIFKLPRPEQGRDAELPILPNSYFDASSGQIISSNGVACGWTRRWAWTGKVFEMIDSVEMPACIDILPNQWLQTYRAIPD